jgi:heparan-alpha-glucosaminide N-acetyltransferase
MTSNPRRLASIDSFRAITMFLMIFVNDLWSLKQIPAWLEHAGKLEDRLGFADTIFPAFLFIVGLSIPFAIQARSAKGASPRSTLIHILKRSLALLVMGIFHVNLENYNKTTAILPKPWWQIGITIAFFLVWLDYSPRIAVWRRHVLQATGIALLGALAFLYKGGTPEEPAWMQLHWYGILGLIGWCYLLCAILYLLSRNKLAPLIAGFIFFIGMNIADEAGWLDFLDPVREYVWIVGSGSLPALTMAGVLTAMLYRKMTEKGKEMQALAWMILLAAMTMTAGFALRPIGGISKIRATPSWVLICTAINLAVFLLLAFIMDIKGRQRWIGPLKPAGTSTLTAYLLPYIHYAIYNLLGLRFALPLVLRTGWIGIAKSLTYALLIITITGLLEKKRIRLCI